MEQAVEHLEAAAVLACAAVPGALQAGPDWSLTLERAGGRLPPEALTAGRVCGTSSP